MNINWYFPDELILWSPRTQQFIIYCIWLAFPTFRIRENEVYQNQLEKNVLLILHVPINVSLEFRWNYNAISRVSISRRERYWYHDIVKCFDVSINCNYFVILISGLKQEKSCFFNEDFIFCHSCVLSQLSGERNSPVFILITAHCR